MKKSEETLQLRDMEEERLWCQLAAAYARRYNWPEDIIREADAIVRAFRARRGLPRSTPNSR